ncbi:uncharacterized protein DMAD_06488 [Drosophila madeirensis]|uniref:Chitin-binding type-2 domain-containing protein n=1 Tax=Drosophila madeirensis TaxID=30013 RepID=A0AAU9FS22_DROMD
MRVALLAVVTLTTVAVLVGAADPECVYRKLRGLSPHWPNPTSCSSYYRCSGKGIARAVTCPAGKEYNPKNGKCATAGRGLCKLSLVAPLVLSTNQCTDEVNGAFLPKSGYCGEYYICDEQQAYAQKCPAGSSFNNTLAVCIPDTNKTCWQNLCVGEADGLLPTNDDNCANYYSCSAGVATLERCPQKSYFDNSLKTCIADTDSVCWQNFCVGMADGSAVADKTNCSVFYLCFDETATTQYCPVGSIFNPQGWNCQPGTCEDTTTVEPCDDVTTTPEPCDEVTTTTEPCDEVTTTTEPCDDVTTVTEPTADCDCAHNVKNGDLVANEQNCRLYDVCVNGVLISGDCGKGNFFDDYLKVCQVDSANVCPDSSEAECKDDQLQVDVQNCAKYYQCKNGVWLSESCSSGSFFDTEVSACKVDSGNVCVDSSTDECNVSDPAASGKNCFSYQTCMNGKWQEEQCSKDFYFDSVLGICRLDETGSCPENKLLFNFMRPDIGNTSLIVSHRGRRSAESDGSCAGGVAQGSIVCHPTDCGKYLLCENGEMVEGSCGVGNVVQNGVCVPDTAATCWVCSNKPNGYQLPTPDDCTSYVSCYNGLAIQHSCGAGEWYNGEVCEIDVTAQCINPCSCASGAVPHPICTKYYLCTDGVAQVVDCAVGEAFNNATGLCSTATVCNAKLCATAADATTYPVAGDTSRFYLCLNKEATIVSCPANTAYDATFGICLAVPSVDCDQATCKGAAEDLTYPTLNCDNSSFCLCNGGAGYIQSCGEGYVYDAVDGICQFTGQCDPAACVGNPEYWVSPDYQDPNSFCLCRVQQPVPVPCPIGYTFSSEDLACVLIPQPDPRCDPNGCSCKADFDTIPALNTDAGFCICVDKLPSYNSCPANTVYNLEDKACLAPEIICTPNACDATECDKLTDYATFPAPDLSAFCYCRDTCPIYKACLNNTVYDPTLGICTEPEDPCATKQCDVNQCDLLPPYDPFKPEGDLQGFCYCEDGFPIYNECPEGEAIDWTFKLCQVPKVDASCTCDASKCTVNMPDFQPFPPKAEDDTAGFCYCDNGEVVYDTCSEGLVFDASEQMCVIPSAPCSVCAPGTCATMDDLTTFKASNTTAGFCLCMSGSQVFVPCETGLTYDSDLGACLSSTAKIVANTACDMTQCIKRDIFSRFSASNTTSGFCTCEEFGVTAYHSCENGELYNEALAACTVEACDPSQCRRRAQFEPFAARNTSEGFCSCNGVAVYHRCDEGHVFDAALGLCTLKGVIGNIACNLLECQKRARYEPFPAHNTRSGFCSCDASDGVSVTFHSCPMGEVFDSKMGVCAEHVIQKRSLEAQEKLACIVDELRSVPANCSQYEVCVEGHWRRRTCTDQRYYNPEQRRCLEPRDDMVCAYARVTYLPACTNSSEAQTMSTRNGSCLQYFRCSGSKWRLRNCPKQHFYSSLMGSCLPLPLSLASKENDRSICNATIIQSPPEDCQHLAVRPSAAGCDSFLMCLDNVWWRQQCPLGMYFSRERNYCVPNDAQQCPQNATTSCVSGQKRGLIGSCSIYDQCSDSQWVRMQCLAGQQFEPLIGCLPSDGRCQANGMRRVCHNGELRPLPLISADGGHCSAFFHYCEEEEWLLGSCLRGQQFSPKLNKCQAHAECREQTQTLTMSAAENSCVGQSDGLSVPDAQDCTRFYLCLQQQPAVLQSCASGSFFDAAQGYCRPNDGTCQLAVCSGVDDGRLVAHPEDCRAYYSCSSQNGTRLHQCEQGQYFHSLLSLCRADHGQCQKESDPGEEQSTGRVCAGQHGVRLPHELYCNLYYACVRGLAIPVECPAQQQYNPVLGACEPEALALEPCHNGQLDGNSSAVYSCGTLQEGSYLANRSDCTRYFICAGGIAVAQRCAAGSFFDPEQLLCVQDDGSCPFVENGNDDEETNNQHVPPDPLVCEGKHGYILPDPANCNNFYICVSGKLRHECCYSGSFFNASLQQCQALELPSDVDSQTELPGNSTLRAQSTLEKQCTDAPSTFDSLCSVIGNGTSVAEQGDCRRYTSCEDDVPVSQRCRNGESFDSLLRICRQSDGTCLMENGERVGVCNGLHGQLARDASNCRGFFVCLHGQTIEGDCGQGLYFNKATSSCELDVLQQCKIDGDDTVIVADSN